MFISYACDESASKTSKRVNRLTDKNPDHVESLLLKARVHVHLNEWEHARNLLKVALSKSQSPRIYQMLSEIEMGETGDDKQAAQWLGEAVEAPRDESWVCANCGEQHSAWQPHCNHCGQFDHITWMLPDAHRTDAKPLLKADII